MEEIFDQKPAGAGSYVSKLCTEDGLEKNQMKSVGKSVKFGEDANLRQKHN